jgi:acyl-CoA synthetase (NDP forming)
MIGTSCDRSMMRDGPVTGSAPLRLRPAEETMPAVPTPPLAGLFAPRSVAVYGASNDPSKLGHTLLRNLASGGAVEDIAVVHPSASEVLGIRARPSLSDAVDLAIVSVPSGAVSSAVRDAVDGGAANVIVLSSGFGETGEDGRRAQADLVAYASRRGARLVGPNCMGVLSHVGGGRWLNGTYFWDLPLVVGGVAMVSQSGAFGGMFFGEVRRRQLGVSRFLSVGNAADIGPVDAIAAIAAHPDTAVIGAFVEGIADGRRFVDVVRPITARLPVVVLKAGKRAAGQRAAASHTGSLAAEHRVVQAAFRRAGVIEADESDDFFDALGALAAPRACGRSIAIVTISGGPSVLAADAAERAGLQVPPPSDATVAAVRAAAPSFAAATNPIDLTPQCDPAGFGPAIGAVFDDPAFDAVVVVDCGLDRVELADATVASMRRTAKPVAAYLLDVPNVEQRLRDAGVAIALSPERAVRTMRAMLR